MASSTFGSNSTSEKTTELNPDFNRVWNSINFDEHNLAAGTIITDQFYGVEFSSSSESEAILFDTNNTTGEDFDLESTNLDNVLIISKDGDSADLDNNAAGGVINVEFEDLVSVNSIGLLDIDEPGSSLTFYDKNSSPIKTVEIDSLGDNSFQEITFDLDNVASFDINLTGSGAVTGIDYSTARADSCNNNDLDSLTGTSTVGVNLDEDFTLSGERKGILLAVDLQNGFLTTPETEEVVKNVVDNADQFDQVWATRFFNRNPNFSRQVNWEEMVSGPETELSSSLTPIVSKTFDKPSYSPPADDLIQALKNEGITTVAVAGVDTDACVMDTALELFDAGIETYVVSNGSASSGGQEYHEAGIKLLERNIGEDYVVPFSELPSMF
ncbi:MAG: cysteine hydrolase family protein [Waterburya sp.]